MTKTPSPEFKTKLENFVTWFMSLAELDQSEIMDMAYNEHKVRDMVRNFSSMPVDQRKTVFQRLGLPNELLNRIPPPSTAASGDLEVEWQEWDGSKK